MCATDSKACMKLNGAAVVQQAGVVWRHDQGLKSINRDENGRRCAYCERRCARQLRDKQWRRIIEIKQNCPAETRQTDASTRDNSNLSCRSSLARHWPQKSVDLSSLSCPLRLESLVTWYQRQTMFESSKRKSSSPIAIHQTVKTKIPIVKSHLMTFGFRENK